MATTANSKMSLKLLIDNNSGKVVFAEAGKDFVDFLFGLKQLPLGIVLSVVSEHGKAADSGSLGRIYESIQNIDNWYLQSSSSSNQTKDSLLKPKMTASNTRRAPLLKQVAYPNQDMEFPQQQKSSSSYSTYYVNGYAISEETNSIVEGHVKEVVTYMVMDDLTVKPTSALSSVALLNNLKVKDVGCLKEKTVEVDTDKGLMLFIRAFLGSTSVLTDVFLPIEQVAKYYYAE